MEKNFYNRKTSEWFRGKEATVTRDLKNGAGDIIKEGEIVEIKGKLQGGLYIRSSSTGNSISAVEPKYVNLI